MGEGKWTLGMEARRVGVMGRLEWLRQRRLYWMEEKLLYTLQGREGDARKNRKEMGEKIPRLGYEKRSKLIENY